MVSASIYRVAAYAKLSRRHVDRLIHGYVDKKGKEVKGLVKRGILSLVAPVQLNSRPAVYRINEQALHEDRNMRPYSAEAAQMDLPGIVKPPKPGVSQAPIGDENPAPATRLEGRRHVQVDQIFG